APVRGTLHHPSSGSGPWPDRQPCWPTSKWPPMFGSLVRRRSLPESSRMIASPQRVIRVIPAIPACPVRPNSGHSANARAYEDRQLASGSSFFPQQRLQRAAQHLAQGGSDSLPVAGLGVLEFAKTLHQIEKLAVDLDRINGRPALEPLAPPSGISGTPLPKDGSACAHP